MENENKDFFDYDSYIKSKGKKKNNKKKSHPVQNEKRTRLLRLKRLTAQRISSTK